MSVKNFNKSFVTVSLVWVIVLQVIPADNNDLTINKKEYFEMPGLNVMVFNDFYPEGHQGGVTIIQNGVRVATLAAILPHLCQVWVQNQQLWHMELTGRTGLIYRGVWFQEQHL